MPNCNIDTIKNFVHHHSRARARDIKAMIFRTGSGVRGVIDAQSIDHAQKSLHPQTNMAASPTATKQAARGNAQSAGFNGITTELNQ